MRKKKKTCSSCFYLMYYPPPIQKMLGATYAFHCLKNKRDDGDDPDLFLKKIKCDGWMDRNNKSYVNYENVTKLVRRKQPLKRKLKRTLVRRIADKKVLKRLQRN